MSPWVWALPELAWKAELGGGYVQTPNKLFTPLEPPLPCKKKKLSWAKVMKNSGHIVCYIQTRLRSQSWLSVPGDPASVFMEHAHSFSIYITSFALAVAQRRIKEIDKMCMTSALWAWGVSSTALIPYSPGKSGDPLTWSAGAPPWCS